MQVFGQKIGTSVAKWILIAAVILAGSYTVSGQTSTNIQVTSSVLQPNVHKLGINLGDQTYWDSGQMMKNLVFENPGFEGLKFRTILKCAHNNTANSCQDDNQYSRQYTGFWKGGTYEVMSGASAGMTGVVIQSTQSATACSGCGQTVQFDKNVNLAIGDYYAVTNFFPGTGDAGWWDTASGGATITTELTDLSPNTPGKQALLLSASGSGQSAKATQYFESFKNLSFIQLNGAFQVTFRAKGVGGNNQLGVSVQRLQGSNAPYLNQTLNLTNSWKDYTLTFTANETGSAVGTVQLVFAVAGANVELDDVALQQTDSDPSNITAFRDDVVKTLKELNPGTIRMMAAGAALGSDIPNQLAPPFARYRESFSSTKTGVSTIPYGIHEFIQLCAAVGSDPWITIPTSTTPAEMTDLMLYLTGDGSDSFSASRIARGQTAPWTTVFDKIHIELGNETWNGDFKGESMAYPGYPQWANGVFGAARQFPGYQASKFDLVIDGWAAVPGYDYGILSTSTQHDTIDIAPYLLYSANNESQSLMFGALFAEPELLSQSTGKTAQIIGFGNTAKVPAKVSVYEVNLGTMIGNITQAQLDQLTPSVGAGIAHTVHMLEMMRIGVQYQNAFALQQYQYLRSDQSLARLWGIVVDMGTTNRRRPQFLTQALANTVIGGSMLQTVHSGADPTWNQPKSSDGVILNGAHYLQSFAFVNQGALSTVIFNLNQTTALQVTFSGPNAPSGAVTVSQITSANITDNNEFSDVVKTTTQSLSAFNPAVGLSLPPFSMTVLTNTSSAVQAPSFSVPAGTYGTAQNVAIASATPGATIYYTMDGSTPTASSTAYSGPVAISKSATLQAMASASGLAPSAITTAAYVIGYPTAATPVFSIASGTYATTQTITITDATAGASIYYTTDGSTPTTASKKYTGPISVSTTQTIQALATATNYTSSAVATVTYTIAKQVATPSLSVGAGTYTASQAIVLSDTTAGATIYYTLNGATPTTTSNKYTGPIKITATTTVKAFATAPNYKPSAIIAATYTIKAPGKTAAPVFSIASGTYPTAQSVILSDATPGAIIYFTVNGAVPSMTSSKYTGPIKVAKTMTIRACAKAASSAASSVASASYIIKPVTPTTATPKFSIAPATYATAQTITLTDTTAGAVIYYTLDGTIPSAKRYTSPIKITKTTTIKAIAKAPSYALSAIASGTYTISAGSTSPTGSGFTKGQMVMNGSAKLVGSSLQLTDGKYSELAAAWYARKVPVGRFTTDFTFQLTKAAADGFTFTLQNNRKGVSASGGNADALGYTGITKSVAIKFDLYDGKKKSSVSMTGMLKNGVSPSTAWVNMASAKISLHNGHLMHVHLAYDGKTLSQTVTDTVTGAQFKYSYAVNLASVLGTSSAYVGFTGSTGGYTAIQNIETWTYSTPTAVIKK